MYSQNPITLQNKNPINAIDMKLLLTTNHCSGDYEERVKYIKLLLIILVETLRTE